MDVLVTIRDGKTFPPTCRLHCRKEFDHVWKGGRRYHTAHFLVIVMQRPSGPTRLGLTVSRKIGGAVARNRVKRILREFFRLSYDLWPFPVDLVVVARQGAGKLSYAELADELDISKVVRATLSPSCSKKQL